MAFNLLAQDLPADSSREGRVELLVRAKDDLLSGRVVGEKAAQFVGRALDEWLTRGGDLEDHLRTRSRRGSHHTAAALAKRFREKLNSPPHRDERHAGDLSVSSENRESNVLKL